MSIDHTAAGLPAHPRTARDGQERVAIAELVHVVGQVGVQVLAQRDAQAAAHPVLPAVLGPRAGAGGRGWWPGGARAGAGGPTLYAVDVRLLL
jgi:hypothetical protein